MRPGSDGPLPPKPSLSHRLSCTEAQKDRFLIQHQVIVLQLAATFLTANNLRIPEPRIPPDMAAALSGVQDPAEALRHGRLTPAKDAQVSRTGLPAK